MFRLQVLTFLFIAVFVVGLALPQQPKNKRPTPVFKQTLGLELPNNATSIRENIVDTFSCEGRIYGYYADIENECQIFHVCMPQARGSSRWSFICPAETVFNQETFVCTRTENSIPCEESDQYYVLNEDIGKVEEEGEETDIGDLGQAPPTPFTRVFRRGKSRRVNDSTESSTPEVASSTVATTRNARILSREKSRQE
ncbi:uncharacterized protein [Venturia canescens]|uniref:uncharacterized protein n=1 Tax=Venturia canescens TaxID=32260 RepID=UPI001C9CF41A|nr:uncharacterized protein LOC122413146 [Venturia canescens]